MTATAGADAVGHGGVPAFLVASDILQMMLPLRLGCGTDLE